MADHVDRDLEPTWTRVLAVWWLIAWRTAILGTIALLVLGLILGFVLGALGVERATLNLVGQIFGMAIYALTILVTLRMALKKRYGSFRIALVAVDD